MLSYRTELGGADRVETDHAELAEAECEAGRDTKPAASDAVVIFGAVLAVFIGFLLLIFAICQPASCLLARTGRYPSAKPDAREVEGASLAELFEPKAPKADPEDPLHTIRITDILAPPGASLSCTESNPACGCDDSKAFNLGASNFNWGVTFRSQLNVQKSQNDLL